MVAIDAWAALCEAHPIILQLVIQEPACALAAAWRLAAALQTAGCSLRHCHLQPHWILHIALLQSRCLYVVYTVVGMASVTCPVMSKACPISSASTAMIICIMPSGVLMLVVFRNVPLCYQYMQPDHCGLECRSGTELT